MAAMEPANSPLEPPADVTTVLSATEPSRPVAVFLRVAPKRDLQLINFALTCFAPEACTKGWVTIVRQGICPKQIGKFL
jgi:hypothetical protein